MSCWGPLTAYRTGTVGPSGKLGITFQRSASLNGQGFDVPCGQCTGCRLEKSRQWAMRCLHEKRLHRENVFITLTYSTENLPPYGSLQKRDFQLFMKRLRKEKGDGIRFYACGEYGDLNKRPHYHAILFNCDFVDKTLVGRNRRGDPYFDSKQLRRIWGLGHVQLGDVSFDSAAYVARYVMKKVTGDGADNHYDVVDADGVLCRRNSEFTLMSRRPGIGTGWFERYGAETYVHDSVVVNGRLVRPPRFYDGKYELIDSERMDVIKRKRRQKALLNSDDNTSARRRVKELLLQHRLAKLHREV